MRKNPEKNDEDVNKNLSSGKLAFFLPNLLNKDFIISDVISSSFVVSNWQRRCHPSKANCTKGLLVGESNFIT